MSLERQAGAPGAEPYGLGPIARLDRELSRREPRAVLVLGLAFVLGLGIAELVSGRVSLAGFYVVPVFLVTWYVGRGRGLAVAAASAALRLSAELARGVYGPDTFPPYWNAGMRFLLYAAVALLVSALRTSELKERELARREHETIARLRALNDLKDTLLHTVSHDLKGPMTVILGAAQTLRDGERLGLTDAQRDELVTAIETSGHKMQRLVTDLLDLDRLDRGVLEPDRRRTDLAELTATIVAEVAAEFGCPIEEDLHPVVVSVDPTKIERVVENLVRNAVTHTPLGTPVHVRVRPEDDGALLVVEDEGLGVAEDLRDVIFEPFAQGEQDPRARGVGIGLSLVARFARLHGGRAWVEDRPGGGASFRVYLPEDHAARRAEEAARARHPSAVRGSHIRSA